MGLFKHIFKSTKFELVVGDIILLYSFERAQDINRDFCQYFKYKYGIDTKEHVNLLISEGYLIPASISESLEAFNTTQLKELCAKYSLQTTGKKIVLIERLKEIPIIKENLSTDLYIVSEIGKKALLDNYAYVQYHHNPYDIEINEFVYLLRRNGTYEKAILSHLNSNEIKLANNENWGLYRNNKLYKAKFYNSIEDYKNEFLYYLETFYCDLSGYGNSFRDRLSDLMIAPGVISYFNENSKYYESELVNKCISECSVPKSYFSNEQFEKVILYLLENDNLDIKQLLALRKNQH